MRYLYEMEITFSQPVRRHTFLLRFIPPTDASQQALGHQACTKPACRLSRGTDAFGNGTELGYIDQAHTMMRYTCEGTAYARGKNAPAVLERIFLYPSELAGADALMRTFAKAHDPGGGVGTLGRAHALMDALRAHMEYVSGITDGQTSASEAFALGRGVCQDMAHGLIALCRAQGIGARYVAGLIPGEGQTHAWAEIYDGERFVGLDPTHARETDEQYLAVSRGRDARDCAVNRGVFLGVAHQKQSVHAQLWLD